MTRAFWVQVAIGILGMLVTALLLVAMSLLWTAVVHAQQLDPLAAVQAYTTADPNNPDRFGLATPDGRFSVTPAQGCDWLADGQTVYIYPNYAVPPWLGLSGTDSATPGCVVRVEGRMSDVPCFTDDAGLCALEVEIAP